MIRDGKLKWVFAISKAESNVMVLRSRKVELLHQEVWGLLLAYNLIRRKRR